jgi:hypothetical protein
MTKAHDDALDEMMKLLAWVDEHRARCWPESLDVESEILPDRRWFEHRHIGPSNQAVVICRRCGERTTTEKAE